MPFVARSGVKIHYEIEGDGTNIVIIPGLGANIEMQRLCGWIGAFPKHRLVVVDPRGHGKSDRPRDPKAHAMQEYRDDLLAVLDISHVEKAVFLGISDGAKISCALAHAYPNRTSALIDLDGIDDRDLCEPPESNSRLDLARTVRSQGCEKSITEAAPTLGFSPDSALMKEFEAADSEMVALELEEWTHWKGPVSLLRELNVPILRLMSGTRESDELERTQQIAVSSSEFHVIPEANHWKLCLEPELTLSLIQDFVSRIKM
jgi:pimeloyl-ACP methyl ester carboxylesterase